MKTLSEVEGPTTIGGEWDHPPGFSTTGILVTHSRFFVLENSVGGVAAEADRAVRRRNEVGTAHRRLSGRDPRADGPGEDARQHRNIARVGHG